MIVIIFFIINVSYSALPNCKILDLPKLKEIADDKINVTGKMTFVLGKVENIVGKGEKAGYQHFLLFSQYFCIDQRQLFPFESYIFCGLKMLRIWLTIKIWLCGNWKIDLKNDGNNSVDAIYIFIDPSIKNCRFYQ